MKTEVSFLQPKEGEIDEKADDNLIYDIGINGIYEGKKWPRP